MGREKEFTAILEQIKKKARAGQNFITSTEIEEAFSALSLSTEQMDMVYAYLRENKIGIDEPADMDAGLEEEERNYLDSYLEALTAIPGATEGEREAITLSAMAGDPDAVERLTELMLPEVPQIAKLYTGQGVSLEDLIGEGNVALSLGVTMLGALEHAHEARGMLGRMIMDAMEGHIAENTRSADIGRQAADRVNKVADAARELSGLLLRKVTVEELSAQSGLPLEEVQEAVRLAAGKIEEIEDERGNTKS